MSSNDSPNAEHFSIYPLAFCDALAFNREKLAGKSYMEQVDYFSAKKDPRGKRDLYRSH